MIDISGFGTGITIVALSSFPTGFTLSSFSDDVDPLVFEDMEPSAFEALFDGSIFVYDKTSPVLCSVSVIPNSDDDQNLKILLQSRIATSFSLPLPDVTTMVIKYPSGFAMLTNGSILRGPPADSIASNGRKKSNTYHFAFGSYAGGSSALGIAASVAENILGAL